MKNEFRTLWLVHDFALALSTSNAHRQPEVYKLAFRSVRSSCVYAKRSTISFSLLSNEYLLITRGEFQSEFRGITVAHTLAQLYLPLLCQLALQHYLSALEWLVGRSRLYVVPPARRPTRGQSVCAVNVNAGAHGIARSELRWAADDDRVISVVVVVL